MKQADARYRDLYFEVPDGLRLHCRDYPGAQDKPPLLCLHGLTRNTRDFEHFAERYSPQFRVLVFEFRGRGLSDYDPQPSRYTPLTYCADVQHLLDHVRAEQAIFVGTSLGGLVTMSMAVLGPGRIAASILNDVGPELGQAGLDRIQSYVGKGERFKSWEEAAQSIAGNQAGAFPNYGPEEWLAAARRNCREESGEVRFDYDVAIADAFQNAGPTPKIDMWPLFRALAAKPLLVVRGALSELLSASTAQKMREAAPCAEFVEVPDVGHAPMLDEPAAMAAIDRFLESLTF